MRRQHACEDDKMTGAVTTPNLGGGKRLELFKLKGILGRFSMGFGGDSREPFHGYQQTFEMPFHRDRKVHSRRLSTLIGKRSRRPSSFSTEILPLNTPLILSAGRFSLVVLRSTTCVHSPHAVCQEVLNRSRSIHRAFPSTMHLVHWAFSSTKHSYTPRISIYQAL